MYAHECIVTGQDLLFNWLLSLLHLKDHTVVLHQPAHGTICTCFALSLPSPQAISPAT